MKGQGEAGTVHEGIGHEEAPQVLPPLKLQIYVRYRKLGYNLGIVDGYSHIVIMMIC